MQFVALVFIFCISGCASVQIPEYISRADHPYQRKIDGSFEKIVSSFIYVLKQHGWRVTNGLDPAVYERDDRYNNDLYQNLLIMTAVKKNYRVLYTSYTHLNVLIHARANTCDVEIRYETKIPLIKQFTSARNDRLVEDILDAVEQEVGR